jgi:hypothetical protein
VAAGTEVWALAGSAVGVERDDSTGLSTLAACSIICAGEMLMAFHPK